MNFRLQGLYVITDPLLTPSATLLMQVEAALMGGARLVQYRDKSSEAQRRLQEALQLQALCRRYAATLIINDDISLALACDADGVHLGQDDAPLAAARHLLGPHKIVGATCHGDPSLATRAMAEGADYLAFGRFFASGTKPDAPAAQLDRVAPRLHHWSVPTAAIGGITLQQAPALITAGFDMLAVIGDVFGHTDITARCRDYATLIANHAQR